MEGIFKKQYTDGVEQSFRSLVKRKRVILVGPARTLVGTKMGTEIDNYDIVVRTNNFFGVTDDMHPDYGKRCDILYLNPKTTRMYGLNKNGRAIRKINKRRKTLYSPIPLSEWASKGLSAVVKFENDGVYVKDRGYVKNRSGVLLKKIPTSMTTIGRYNTLGFRERPLLGIAAAADLLRYKPGSLHITGFDFYIDGKTWIDGYPTEQVDGLHHYEENANFLKLLLDKNLITVDDNLRLIIDQIVKHGHPARPRKKKARGGWSWRQK